MSRHIVCLTFDHDHVSGLIARGMTSPTAISRGEYDIVVIPRLVALLERYEIKATFFTPGHTIDSTPAAVAPYVEAGHELAHHGWTHRLPVNLSRDEEEEEIVRGNKSIKRISGRTARGYRSPAWDLSPHSIDLLLKHGIQYDSSLMGNDYDCYYARQGDVAELMKPLVRGRETALVEMPISWSLDDYPAFEYMRLPNGSVQQGLMNATGVLENFVDDFTYMTRILRLRDPDLYLPPACHWPRPSHDDAGTAHPAPDRGRCRLHDHGSCHAGLAGAPPRDRQGCGVT